MSAESEIKESSEEVKAKDSSFSWKRLVKIWLTFLICAFIFIATCSGGLKSGIRGVILGACILLGLFTVKSFYKDSINWKKRVGYFALAGILSGLLAAIIISLLEMKTGSPTLRANPYTQTTANLFFMCPLYGLFMLGAFAFALKLPWILRFLAILAGAALVSAFGLEELAHSSELSDYVLGLLKGIVIYYPNGIGNCFAFVFLWCVCAEILWHKIYFTKVKFSNIINIFAYFIIVGIISGFIIDYGFQFNSIRISNERLSCRYENIVFNEKLTGIIVLPETGVYFDCQKRKFINLPGDIERKNNFSYNSNNKKLRISEKNNFVVIEKIEDGKVIKKYPSSDGMAIAVNNTIYYKIKNELFRLQAPGYDKEEMILELPNNYYFYISPNEKFIVYTQKYEHYHRCRVLSIMELKSKKTLPLNIGYCYDPYWFKDMKEFRKALKKGISK